MTLEPKCQRCDWAKDCDDAEEDVVFADRLRTARKINGTAFDGTGDITTAKWGQARNISISDADGTNIGEAVSVNGSKAVALKLPANIKADLTGTAACATADAQGNVIAETYATKAETLTTYGTKAPIFTEFGGQLAQLRQDLLAPNKPVSITFIGDSITEGAGATGYIRHSANSATDHTLRAARDGYASMSFVNQFKRWIKERLEGAIYRERNTDDHGTPDDISDDTYEYGVTGVTGNYSDAFVSYTDPDDGLSIVRADPTKSYIQGSATNTAHVFYAGENSERQSVVTYTLMQELAPRNRYLSTIQDESGTTAFAYPRNTVIWNDPDNHDQGYTLDPGYRCNEAIEVTIDTGSLDHYGGLAFPLWGNSFIVHYMAEADSLPYDVYLDGVLEGTYTTTTAAQDVTAKRVHTLSTDAAGKTVEIRVHAAAAAEGTGRLVLQSVVLPKVVKITNNGISGTSVYGYRTYCLPNYGGTKTPEENFAEFRNSVEPGDYVFVQFGANDRAEAPRGAPETDSGVFSYELARAVAILKAYGCAPILMCSNPCQTRAKDYMDMGEVRLRIISVAQQYGVDFIDNFGIFNGLAMSTFTADNLHPNDLGHTAMCHNIVGALLAARGIEDLEFKGLKIAKNNPQIELQNTLVRRGTVPDMSRQAVMRFTDGAETPNDLGFVRNIVGADGSAQVELRVMQNAAAYAAAALGLMYPATGDPYAYAPTPAGNASSTEVLTAAWLRLADEKALGGNIRLAGAALERILRGYGNAAALLSLYANANVSGGASLRLYGKSHATLPGTFNLLAANGTDSASLAGSPDGTLKWDGNTVQTTSDERLKTALAPVSDAALDAWADVRWGAFQFLASVEEKGEDNARLHTGVIAQQIQRAFAKHGMDACAYGILCLDVWPDEYAEEWEEHEDGTRTLKSRTLVRKAGELWMVRYAEALAMEAAYQRRRAERLEARLTALETRVDLIEAEA